MASKVVTLILAALCAACANSRPIDISNPAQQPAVLCDIETTGSTSVDVRLAAKQILIYPSKDLKNLQIAHTGEFEMTPICDNKDLCDIQQFDGDIRITIRPDLKLHPEMLGFKTTYQFDQKLRTLIYTSGGGLDSGPEKPIFYKCRASPRVAKD
jgi:hypothetical protein